MRRMMALNGKVNFTRQFINVANQFQEFLISVYLSGTSRIAPVAKTRYGN